MLGLVDVPLFAHLDHPDLPDFSMAEAEKWAAGIPLPAYAIDDQTAIVVLDGEVEVVSEDHGKRFVPEVRGSFWMVPLEAPGCSCKNF